MISFVIPAHNEEALIGRSIGAIHDTARKLGLAYEIVVVNDSSTDRTGDLARDYGARVIEVQHRQIAATRNAGARAVAGETLIFVDADTLVTVPALRAALRTLRRGAVGGGCCVRFDGPVPLYAWVLLLVLRLVAPVIGLAGGCFLFCPRRVYLASGGLDETLFCSEEVDFATRLKRQGRFVVVRGCVVTSGWKVRAYSAWELVKVGLHMAREGGQSLRRREGLDFWYGPRNK